MPLGLGRSVTLVVPHLTRLGHENDKRSRSHLRDLDLLRFGIPSLMMVLFKRQTASLIVLVVINICGVVELSVPYFWLHLSSTDDPGVNSCFFDHSSG